MLHDPLAPAAGGVVFQGLDGGFGRDAHGAPRAEGCQRVEDQVLAGTGDSGPPALALGVQHKVGGTRRRADDGRRDIRPAALQPVANHAQPGDLHLREQVVIIAEQQHRPVRQGVRQLQLGLENIFPGAEPFDVRNAHIGDNAHHGAGGIAEIPDLARRTHAHFHHRDLRLRGDAHQRFGRADLVILIAFGFDDAKGGSHDRRHHFLGGGFTYAAGNADDCGRHFAAVQRRDLQKGAQAAGNPKHPPGGGIIAVVLRHGRLSPCRQRRVDVIMAVHPLARQGDEQRPRPGLAAVGDHPGDLPLLRGRRAAQRRGYFSQ